MQIEIELPEDDRKDREGMYEDLCEMLGEQLVEQAITEAASSALAEQIETLYDNREQLVQQQAQTRSQ